MTVTHIGKFVAGVVLFGVMFGPALVPRAADAAEFGTVALPQINGLADFYASGLAQQQIEINQLAIERQRDELARRRQQSTVYCRLPDGHFVQC